MPVIRCFGVHATRFSEALESLRRATTVPEDVLKQVVYEVHDTSPTTLIGKKPASYIEVEGGRDVDDEVVAAMASNFFDHGLDTQVRWRDGTMQFFPLSDREEPRPPIPFD